MRLHSTVGLITNSSSEVFWVPPGRTVDEVRDLIDELWYAYCRAYTPEQIKEDYFSFYPEDEDLPINISNQLEIRELSEEEAEAGKKRWLSFAVRDARRTALKIVGEQEETLNWLDNNELYADEVELIYEAASYEYTQSEYFKSLRVDGRASQEEIDSGFGYVSDISEKDLELVDAIRHVQFIDSYIVKSSVINRDKQFSDAHEPGAIYVDNNYHGAPYGFMNVIREFFGATGGQIG